MGKKIESRMLSLLACLNLICYEGCKFECIVVEEKKYNRKHVRRKKWSLRMREEERCLRHQTHKYQWFFSPSKAW